MFVNAKSAVDGIQDERVANIKVTFGDVVSLCRPIYLVIIFAVKFLFSLLAS